MTPGISPPEVQEAIGYQVSPLNLIAADPVAAALMSDVQPGRLPPVIAPAYV
jgi:hypothetical protein